LFASLFVHCVFVFCIIATIIGEIKIYISVFFCGEVSIVGKGKAIAEAVAEAVAE